MGLHDKLAMKAFLRGKGSEEFKKASDNKANAAWFLLAVSLAVSYFSDSKWYLLPLALMIFAIIQSISATLIAERIEKLERPSERDNGE
ncbi:hypothetical protein [Polynucleobacter sp. AP-Sving-400A-A2]|uniref:hypothetical protein n=1 Tax=Polynucleobacter sp. AP-Sving-400A-A2 TaxID=2081049 RepID=UPI001BFD0D13|nr:hypothetical protein [Polynucleobacter sp. AP-Sving-400A-A2]QWE15357.1 hypothetical protein C2758_04320 [Polynucleobacter sp. AP-Sving-400A-A2]